VVALLAKMKDLTFSNINVQYEYWSTNTSIRKLAVLQQGPEESLPSYYKRWTAGREVAEEQWGLWYPTKFVENEDDVESVRNKFQACAFLAGVDRTRFGKVVEELNNSFLAGNNNYPDTVEACMNMLSHRMGNADKQDK
jgi:hypothetical protein